MNTLELMDSKLSSFSKTDRSIYEMIKKFPADWAEGSITELSDKTKITKPAMTRFAKKLGFSGFAEFQYQLAMDLRDSKASKVNFSRAEQYGKLLKQAEESTDLDQIRNLIRRMKKSRKVILIGTNLSRLPAESLLIGLSLHNDICSMILQADIMPYHYNKDDLIIIYSAITGNSHQELLKTLRRSGVTKPYMVLVTVNSKHPLRHNFDEMIVLPTLNLKESGSLVFSDTFSFFMFNDLFINELNQMGES